MKIGWPHPNSSQSFYSVSGMGVFFSPLRIRPRPMFLMSSLLSPRSTLHKAFQLFMSYLHAFFCLGVLSVIFLTQSITSELL